MGARTKARLRALDILFEADVRAEPPLETLADHERRRIAGRQPPLNEYTMQLVRAVAAERAAIDATITKHATNWDLDRMPNVDRNILRLAVAELRAGEVPAGVVISEAVNEAKSLSTDDSPAFINGLLGAIARSSE